MPCGLSPYGSATFYIFRKEKNMGKKILTVILAALFIVSAVAMTSCQFAETGNDRVTIPKDTDENPDGAPTVVDFNGYNYRMMGQGFDKTAGAPLTICVEELTTDVISNAWYLRNQKVQTLYNVKITAKEQGNSYLLVKEFTGEDLVDVFFNPEKFHYVNTPEYAYNLLGISTLRLDRDYWDQNHNEALTVNGVLQTCVGNIYGSDEMWLNTVILNNDLFTDLKYDVEEFHKAVLDGKWYYEDFYNYVKQGTRDIDGIPGMTSSDQYGLMTSWDIYWQLYNAADLNVIEKDSDGDYQFTFNNEETYNVLNLVEDICKSSETTQFAETWNGTYNFAGMCTSFTKNHGLFCTMRILDMEALRSMDADYTILPIPKIYESQESYHSVENGNAVAIWIPTTVSDPEKVGLITEALAYYSDDYQKALYDKILMEKYARDQVSQNLLKTVFTSVKWQMDQQMGIADFATACCHRWAEKRLGITDFASKTKQLLNESQDNLDAVIKALEDSKKNTSAAVGEK